MEKLFTPDTGLMVWTIISFVALVLILGRFGWKPLIKGLNDREQFLLEQKDAAEKARAAAENLKADYERQLANTQADVRKLIAAAKEDSDAQGKKIIEEARRESERILAQGQKSLANETARLKSELQAEVASLSLLIAEKIVRRAVDPAIQKEALAASVKELEAFKS